MFSCAFLKVMNKPRLRTKALTVSAIFWCLVFVWVNTNYSDEEVLKWITVSDNKLKDPLLNHHQFSYSLNTDICQSRKADIVVIVHTAVDNSLHRMKSRDTWAGIIQIDQHSIVTIFMVGQTMDYSMQQLLVQESRYHNDIVQGNFLDSYRNLTYKHIMALGWVNTHCPDAKLIVKVDDDVLVNLFNLATYIYKYGFQNDFLYCLSYTFAFPKRISGDKWYVGYNDYPFMMYPVFCSGAAYLISPNAAMKLFQASSDIRFFWIDDLYVTGFLVLKVGLRHTQMIPGHDFVNTSTLTKDSMFLDAQHVWYSQWDYIIKSVPSTLFYKAAYLS
ncbi:beta-1,3-galactosyltransferase 5-like [Haliotis cracherodii]|uniref:beta-1,3-galactosyltransferase 5-like n=1 Tax=Haliotis cracherodii TaxID=6455 RepID=UPI0039EBB609